LFDSLRAIAALSVLTFHVCATTGALGKGRFGDVLAMLSRGLILFFVISGFLLYRPYVPAYWVALTVLAIYPGIEGVFSDDWWRYYFFLQAYSQDTFGGGIPVAWTLCVEVAFYISLPLWALAVGRVRLGSGPRAWLRAELGALALLALGGVAVQVAGARQLVSVPLSESLLGQSTWFAIGMALAVASVAAEFSERESWARRAVVNRPGLCWLVAGAALVGLAFLLHPGGLLGIAQAIESKRPVADTLAGIALTAVLGTLLVLPAVFGEQAGGLPRRVLAAAPLAWLGLISYGLYLWHLPLTQWLALSADPQHFSASGVGLLTKVHPTTPILFVLSLACTTVVAAASYYLVELPFLRRKET
jgi:peptidoglycan/LPS O-acetylase OafA/YrhL